MTPKRKRQIIGVILLSPLIIFFLCLALIASPILVPVAAIKLGMAILDNPDQSIKESFKDVFT